MSSDQRGFTLVEAVVTMSVFALGVIIASQVILTARRLSDEGRDTVQAANHLEEGLEAVRSRRDAAWTNVSTDGQYHLVATPGSPTPWNLDPSGTETIGKFSRTIAISTARREDTDESGTLTAGDKLVPSGGAFDDPDTKKVVATVTWKQGTRTVTRTMSAYLTNWQQ